MKKLFIIPVIFLFLSSCQRETYSNLHPDLKSLQLREGQSIDVITNAKCVGNIDLYSNCVEENFTNYSKNDYPINVNVCNCSELEGTFKMYQGVIVLESKKDFIEVTILSKTDLTGQDFVNCIVTYNLQSEKRSEKRKPLLIANI